MSKYNLPIVGKPRNRRRKLSNGDIECLFYDGVTVVSKYEKTEEGDVCTYEKKYYSWGKSP